MESEFHVTPQIILKLHTLKFPMIRQVTWFAFQTNPTAQGDIPFVALNEESKLIIFPLLGLHEEAPCPGSFFPWKGVTHLSASNACPLERWVHIGCQVCFEDTFFFYLLQIENTFWNNFSNMQLNEGGQSRIFDFSGHDRMLPALWGFSAIWVCWDPC